MHAGATDARPSSAYVGTLAVVMVCTPSTEADYPQRTAVRRNGLDDDAPQFLADVTLVVAPVGNYRRDERAVSASFDLHYAASAGEVC